MSHFGLKRNGKLIMIASKPFLVMICLSRVSEEL